jgi:hypothetical protein
VNIYYTISNQFTNTNKGKQTHNIQIQINKHTLYNFKSIHKYKHAFKYLRNTINLYKQTHFIQFQIKIIHTQYVPIHINKYTIYKFKDVNIYYTISNQFTNTNKGKQTHNIQIQISKHTLYNFKSIHKYKHAFKYLRNTINLYKQTHFIQFQINI